MPLTCADSSRTTRARRGLALMLGAAAGLAFTIGAVVGAADQTPPAQSATKEQTGVLDYTMNLIDGSPKNLSDYKGKVVLIVNVASRCGYTPQYAGLQKLFQDKSEKGLVVLGFPANEFMSQEPGSNVEIANFCSSTYGVSFPMFEKIVVKGDNAHPLYKKLAAAPAPMGGEPKWNFTKFLLNRKGEIVGRFEPATRPDDPALVARIDELLATKP